MPCGMCHISSFSVWPAMRSVADIARFYCSTFFYKILLEYWSMILFVLSLKIGIDLCTNLDKAFYC